jgi:hypothetical protein
MKINQFQLHTNKQEKEWEKWLEIGEKKPFAESSTCKHKQITSWNN